MKPRKPMFLVHKKKQGHGKWEVAWTWLPFFLASDQSLVKKVDQALTERFKGTDLSEDGGHALMHMHNTVIETILEKYPMQGLGEYLASVKYVNPEERT
jgi:hypothetical protein